MFQREILRRYPKKPKSIQSLKGGIKIELNKIYNEDCIEGMKRIPHKSISLVLTDPPYNISVKNNFHTMRGRAGIDFGEWDKGFDLLKWIRPAVATLKEGGSIIIFNSWQNMSYIKDELTKCDTTVKEMIIWKKNNPMPRNRDRLYVTSCEYAIWAVKGKGWSFNRQRDTYENTVFEYPIVSHKYRLHPTQKPINLIEDLINIHSDKNDTILDPFMGSGTTAAACINTNRNYIGFELDRTYCDITNDRIKTILSKQLNHNKELCI